MTRIAHRHAAFAALAIHSAIGLAAALFHASPALAQTRYRIVDLTEVGQPFGVVQSEARAISEDGTVIGFEILPDFLSRAITWLPDEATIQFPSLLQGDNANLAWDISRDGVVLGLSNFVEVIKQGNLIIILEDQKATTWTNGEITNLNDKVNGGDTSFSLESARRANESGQIIGWSREKEGPPFLPIGFITEDGFVTSLGDLTRPMDLNNHGLIVGFEGFGQDHAYQWDNGIVTSLHEHELIGGVTSRAWGVNDAGIIVGEIQFNIAHPEEPAFWIDGTPVQIFPDITRSQGIASAINEKGQIVGMVNDLDNLNDGWHGFILEDGVRTDLFDLIDDLDNWTALLPLGVNERGQIVGHGVHNNTLGRAFLMDPINIADILDIVVVRGTHIAGVALDMAGSDDRVVRTRSELGFTAFEPNVMDIIVGHDNGIDSPKSLELTIESRLNNPGGVARLRLMNFNTGQFEQVDQYGIGTAEIVHTTAGVDPTGRIHAETNRIELSIKHVVLATFTAQGFDSFFDQVQIWAE